MRSRLSSTFVGVGVAVGWSLVGLVSLSGAASASECSADDVFRDLLPRAVAAVEGAGLEVTNGRLATEGADWQSHGLRWTDRGAAVVFELPEAVDIQALVLQADNNDVYRVEVWAEAGGWTATWAAPAVSSPGLRTRLGWLPAPVAGRRFRVRAEGGDGAYALASLRAYCRRPEVWPDLVRRTQERVAEDRGEDRGGLTLVQADSIRGVLALVGLLVVLWAIAVARAGNPTADRRARAAGLILVAALSALAWWNFLRFHFPRFVHVWEHYHYYIGARYFDELGYTHMYACAVVADAESGVELTGRRYRNLVGNEMEPAESALAFSAECHRRFSDERWREFERDLDYFRRRMGADRWAKAQHDHGYNATPVWRLLGGLVSSLGDASDGWLRGRALVDPILLGVMWGFVFWAFGWRSACVALVWWGTNWPARYFWVGGGLLRQDWLVALVIGACLARRGKMFGAGALVTYSALLRIFPGFVVIPLILKIMWQCYGQRRLALTGSQWRFVAGCLVALLVLVPASMVHSGASSWGGFVDNSRKHVGTPLTNNMGLKTLVTFEPSTRARVVIDNDQPDPFGAWKRARREAWSSKRPLWAMGLLAFLLLVARAARARDDWVALCLGAAVIPFAAELTCYYYSFLLLIAFVGDDGDRRPQAALLGLSLVTVVVAKLGLWYDELFTLTSLAVLVVLVPIVYWAYRPKAVAPPGGDTARDGG